MQVDLVNIELTGKYDLTRLATLNFKQNIHGWYFLGVMHRYEFLPINKLHVRVSIRARAGRVLIHPITLTNIGDWVRQCIDTIDVEGVYRSTVKGGRGSRVEDTHSKDPGSSSK